MPFLRPGNYRCEWWIEVPAEGAPSFNASLCESSIRSGLESLARLNAPVQSSDPASARNPFARFDRFIGFDSGRGKCTVYLTLARETDEHQLNVVAARAFKAAFGSYSAEWSVDGVAVAFDGDTTPAGSSSLRILAHTYTFGLVRLPPIGDTEATFTPYVTQETAPPPSTVSFFETPGDRDAPSSVADRLSESLSTAKNALVGPNGLDTSLLPIEYKIVGGVILGIAGLVAIGYAAKQLKGII